MYGNKAFADLESNRSLARPALHCPVPHSLPELALDYCRRFAVLQHVQLPFSKIDKLHDDTLFPNMGNQLPEPGW
jgi:hypothetical protein